MTISHIVAAAENGTIGVDGQLPWNIPEDLKFFKDKTKGHAIIMGRKTFESVGHPLPKRLNVVVTRQKDYKAEGAHVVGSIEEGIDLCKMHTDMYGDEIFIIGGGEIYQQSLPFTQRVYLTRIHKDVIGDAKYPELDLEEFVETQRSERTDPMPFTFLTFERRSLRK